MTIGAKLGIWKANESPLPDIWIDGFVIDKSGEIIPAGPNHHGATFMSAFVNVTRLKSTGGVLHIASTLGRMIRNVALYDGEIFVNFAAVSMLHATDFALSSFFYDNIKNPTIRFSIASSATVTADELKQRVRLYDSFDGYVFFADGRPTKTT